jgi:hypothetical protein
MSVLILTNPLTTQPSWLILVLFTSYVIGFNAFFLAEPMKHVQIQLPTHITSIAAAVKLFAKCTKYASMFSAREPLN